jgi:coenzyme F420-reducing hydrogenase delta subunit
MYNFICQFKNYKSFLIAGVVKIPYSAFVRIATRGSFLRVFLFAKNNTLFGCDNVPKVNKW